MDTGNDCEPKQLAAEIVCNNITKLNENSNSNLRKIRKCDGNKYTISRKLIRSTIAPTLNNKMDYKVHSLADKNNVCDFCVRKYGQSDCNCCKNCNYCNDCIEESCCSECNQNRQKGGCCNKLDKNKGVCCKKLDRKKYVYYNKLNRKKEGCCNKIDGKCHCNVNKMNSLGGETKRLDEVKRVDEAIIVDEEKKEDEIFKSNKTDKNDCNYDRKENDDMKENDPCSCKSCNKSYDDYGKKRHNSRGCYKCCSQSCCGSWDGRNDYNKNHNNCIECCKSCCQSYCGYCNECNACDKNRKVNNDCCKRCHQLCCGYCDDRHHHDYDKKRNSSKRCCNYRGRKCKKCSKKFRRIDYKSAEISYQEDKNNTPRSINQEYEPIVLRLYLQSNCNSNETKKYLAIKF